MTRLHLFAGASVVLIACGGHKPEPASPTPPAPSSPPSITTTTNAPSGTPSGPGPATTSGRHYGMQDLEALAKSDSWRELFEHLEDVAPAERNDAWKSLAVTAATKSVLADRKANRDRVQLARTAAAFAERYPALRSAKEFATLRADIGVEAVGQCAAENQRYADCEWLAATFEGDNPHALAAAQAAMDHGHRPLALTLFRMVSDTDARGNCQNDRALAVVAEWRTRDYDKAASADATTIHERCQKLKKK